MTGASCRTCHVISCHVRQGTRVVTGEAMTALRVDAGTCIVAAVYRCYDSLLHYSSSRVATLEIIRIRVTHRFLSRRCLSICMLICKYICRAGVQLGQMIQGSVSLTSLRYRASCDSSCSIPRVRVLLFLRSSSCTSTPELILLAFSKLTHGEALQPIFRSFSDLFDVYVSIHILIGLFGSDPIHHLIVSIACFSFSQVAPALISYLFPLLPQP